MVEPGTSHWRPTSQDMKDPGELKEGELSQTECAALERIVWRKLDKRVLPLLPIFFLLAAVNRINITNARLAGLQTSLAMSNYQFTVALTLTSVPFIAAELPSTLLLKHVGPNIMLPAMVTLWGVVSATQGLVNNYSELLGIILSIYQWLGGLFPCIVLYFSFFYPRKRLQIRIVAFFTAISSSGGLSALLAAAINQLNGKGGKPGWAWIFILEGIFPFVFGIISFLVLPRSPEKARFLTEKERAYVVSTLKHAGSVSEDDDKDRFSWREVIRSVKSPHVCLLAIAFFFSGAIVPGLAYFQATIVAGLGYAGVEALLMSTLPSTVSIVLSFISAIVSDRYQCRGYIVIFSSFLEVIGFTMFYASTLKYIRYTSLFFSLTGAYCATPALITWLANNSAPYSRRATAVAVASIMTELGGLLATWLLGLTSPPPNYTSAAITFIVMSIAVAVFSTANLVYLWQENRSKVERRVKTSKEQEPEGLGDRSAWFMYSL